MDSSRINIVFASDERYFPGLIGTLVSIILFSSSKFLKFYIIDGGISESNKSELERIIRYANLEYKPEFINPDLEKLKNLPPFWFDGPMPYARILLPEIILEEKVIYIDTDILFTKDITKLWATDLENKTCGACLEICMNTIASDCSIYEDLNINPDDPHFNSGLLILDLKKARENKLCERTLTYLKEYPDQCKHHDQSALNITLNGDLKLLDQSWNVQSHKGSFSIVNDYKKILNFALNFHFVTSNKPWLKYGESFPYRMFAMILSELNISFKSKSYLKSKYRSHLQSRLMFILPLYFQLKALTYMVVDSKKAEKSLKAKSYWQEKIDEYRMMDTFKSEIDSFLVEWKVKIQNFKSIK